MTVNTEVWYPIQTRLLLFRRPIHFSQ